MNEPEEKVTELDWKPDVAIELLARDEDEKEAEDALDVVGGGV